MSKRPDPGQPCPSGHRYLLNAQEDACRTTSRLQMCRGVNRGGGRQRGDAGRLSSIDGLKMLSPRENRSGTVCTVRARSGTVSRFSEPNGHRSGTVQRPGRAARSVQYSVQQNSDSPGTVRAPGTVLQKRPFGHRAPGTVFKMSPCRAPTVSDQTSVQS